MLQISHFHLSPLIFFPFEACFSEFPQEIQSFFYVFSSAEWMLKENKKNTNQVWLYKMQSFISFEMMPVWAEEEEKEAKTSQNECQESNKNSCQGISQCKKIYYTVDTVSAHIYMGINIQNIQNLLSPKPKMLIICLTVRITSKTDHSLYRWAGKRWITYQNKYFEITHENTCSINPSWAS